jgi:hypothetical protein
MTHKIRTTMRPWETKEVSDQDYTDLKRQGLLVDEGPAPKVSNSSKAGTGQNQEN